MLKSMLCFKGFLFFFHSHSHGCPFRSSLSHLPFPKHSSLSKPYHKVFPGNWHVSVLKSLHTIGCKALARKQTSPVVLFVYDQDIMITIHGIQGLWTSFHSRYESPCPAVWLVESNIFRPGHVPEINIASLPIIITLSYGKISHMWH